MKGMIVANMPFTSILGCTDPQAPNYNPQATQDDGSCSIASICSTPTGLNTYDVVHTRATFNFTSTGADYYKIRVKVNGGLASNYSAWYGYWYSRGSTKTKYFLTADASYEWQVRAWCIDGSVLVGHHQRSLTHFQSVLTQQTSMLLILRQSGLC